MPSAPRLHRLWVEPSPPLAELARQNQNSLEEPHRRRHLFCFFSFFFPFHLIRKGCYGPHSRNLHLSSPEHADPQLQLNQLGLYFSFLSKNTKFPLYFQRKVCFPSCPFHCCWQCSTGGREGVWRGLIGMDFRLSEVCFRLLGGAAQAGEVWLRQTITPSPPTWA